MQYCFLDAGHRSLGSHNGDFLTNRCPTGVSRGNPHRTGIPLWDLGKCPAIHACMQPPVCAVTSRKLPQFPFPVQLMLFAEEELGPVQSSLTAPRSADKKTTKEWAQLAHDTEQRLYAARPGERNERHFDALRFWAYRWQGNMGAGTSYRN